MRAKNGALATAGLNNTNDLDKIDIVLNGRNHIAIGFFSNFEVIIIFEVLIIFLGDNSQLMNQVSKVGYVRLVI